MGGEEPGCRRVGLESSPEQSSDWIHGRWKLEVDPSGMGGADCDVAVPLVGGAGAESAAAWVVGVAEIVLQAAA